jgi:hypothetical protein
MAIPVASESEQLCAVRDFYLTLEFSDLLPLRQEDACLIGTFVQVFNFIELNLRRSVEVFCAANLLQRKNHFYPSELVKSVKCAVTRLGLSDPELIDVLGKLDEIEFRRPFRNLLAHWAGRRLPGHDAIVLLSMDSRDALSVVGENAISKDHCIYSIMLLPDLRGLLKHVSAYDEWLGRKASEWHILLA